MLFAAAVTGLVAGAALPLQATKADAAPGCWKASVAKYPGPGHYAERHAFRKWCRQQWRAHKAAARAAA
jgi:hypothetical protein